MDHPWIKHIAVVLTLAAMLLALGSCVEQVEPTVQVNAPELVNQDEEAEPTSPPLALNANVGESVAETPAETEAPIEEAPIEEAPPEELSSESTPDNAVPELLSANDEVLIFFPSIQIGDSLESVVHNFVRENYMNLVLTYVGEADSLMEGLKDNKHIVYCKNASAEGVIISSRSNRQNNYATVIMGKDGDVFSYILPNTNGDVKTPRDYPPLSANFPQGKIFPELAALINALTACGISME